jgi:hypothetical protein
VRAGRYETYRPQRYYYEVVALLRRVVMVALVTALGSTRYKMVCARLHLPYLIIYHPLNCCKTRVVRGCAVCMADLRRRPLAVAAHDSQVRAQRSTFKYFCLL